MLKETLNNWILNRYTLAIIIIVLLGLWMYSAFTKTPEKLPTENTNYSPNVFTVLAKKVKLQSVTPEIKISGVIRSDNNLTVLSQASGKVTQVLVKKGDFVDINQLLIELDIQNFVSELERAKADYQNSLIQFNSEKNLFEKGLSSQSKMALAKANLNLAKANLASADLKYQNRFIRSDIKGEINNIYVELGDVIGVNQPIIEIVDLDNLSIDSEILLSEMIELQKAQSTSHDNLDVSVINPNNQQSIRAKINFVSKKANPKSRAYPIEIDILEKQRDFSLEKWVEIIIHLPEQKAYPIERSLLLINSQGDYALNIVSNNTVKEVAIKIIKDDGKQVWITGLSENQNIITRGSGFVKIGEQVEVVLNDD